MKKIISALLLLAVFAGCEDEKDKTIVVFYTNAQIVTNCDSLEVVVGLDDKLCGILKSAYEPPQPFNIQEAKGGGILKVEVERGTKHTFSAVYDVFSLFPDSTFRYCLNNELNVIQGEFCTSDDYYPIFLNFQWDTSGN